MEWFCIKNKSGSRRAVSIRAGVPDAWRKAGTRQRIRQMVTAERLASGVFAGLTSVCHEPQEGA